MEFPLTTKELIAASEPLAAYGALHQRCSGVIFDSRRAFREGLFACVVGEQRDGHQFIDEVMAHGALGAIGSDTEAIRTAAARYPNGVFVLVDEVQRAVQAMAHAVRAALDIPVIAVSGACGKTTTKDLAASILRQSAPIVATHANHNNLWGVPQTLLQLRRDHRAAVIEIGTNSLDELGILGPLVAPTIAYVTSIGPTHLAGFKSMDGVVRAETEHLLWMAQHAPQPIFLMNLDDPYITQFFQQHQHELRRGQVVTISQRDRTADVYLSSLEPVEPSKGFGYHMAWCSPWGEGSATLPLPGEFNVMNALGALSIAMASGVCTLAHVAQGLAAPQISALRSELRRTKRGALVYNDVYNASPLSVAALLRASHDIRTRPGSSVQRVVAVMGDMLELGEEAARYHREAGEAAAREKVDLLLSVGEFAAEWQRGFGGAGEALPHREALVKRLIALRDESGPETLFILKGSRGMKFEELVILLSDEPAAPH